MRTTILDTDNGTLVVCGVGHLVINLSSQEAVHFMAVGLIRPV